MASDIANIFQNFGTENMILFYVGLGFWCLTPYSTIFYQLAPRSPSLYHLYPLYCKF